MPQADSNAGGSGGGNDAGKGAAASAGNQFGWFQGVFTPSILTILGVIMYLRVGWVVGNAGLMGTIFIVLIAHAITMATGLSVAALATNRTVKTGGAYYMISRSLGPDVGGAIGIPLYLAQAISVTFYVAGFAESVVALYDFGNAAIAAKVIGTVILVGLTALSLYSTNIALQTQYFVMAAIGLSLVSFLMGSAFPAPVAEPALFASEGAASFWEVFSVFFPAVTGIMAGVSMSGDLRDSRRAIPVGTLAAIVVGMAVYLLIPIILAYRADVATLRHDLSIFQKTSWYLPAVVAGVWGATLSSAVGSILGAPRTLQALADDGAAPRFLGKGFGPGNEPRRALVLTFGIAQVGVLMGGLDLIAPVLTMFFLNTYGMVNLASALMKWSNSPSYRPTFKVPAWVSFFGFIACYYVMSVINLAAMLVAALLSLGIWALLARREMTATWGDTRHGIWSAIVRAGLMALRGMKYSPENWRPNMVVFGGPPRERVHLLKLALWIGGARGLVTYFYLIRGTIQEHFGRAKALEAAVNEKILADYGELFTRIEVVRDVYAGIRTVAQASGLVGMQPNSALMGWSSSSENAAEYGELVRDLEAMDLNVMLVRWDEERQFGDYRRIDVWWGGLENNGGLMLLLAHLLTIQREWRKALVMVKNIVPNPQAAQSRRRVMEDVLEQARLGNAHAVTIVKPEQATIAQVIHSESKDADLVLLGMRTPDEGRTAEFVERYNDLMKGLPTCVLVRGASEFEGAKVLIED